MKNAISIISFFLFVAFVFSSVPCVVIAKENAVENADVASDLPTIETKVAEMLTQEHVLGEVVVRFYDTVSHQTSLDVLNTVLGDNYSIVSFRQNSTGRSNFCECYLVSIEEHRMLDVLIALNSNSFIKVASPNFSFSFEDELADEGWTQTNQSFEKSDGFNDVNAIATTDSYDSDDQWALDKIGVMDAWNKGFTGSNEITIAVFDTGIDTDHPDLQEHIDWSRAYNAVTMQGGSAAYVEDTFGHGTKVTGIIAADLDQWGISGVCSNVTIVPVKIGDSGANSWDIETAFEYADAQDFDIVNYSFTMKYTACLDEIEAWGGMLVTSAGNMNNDMFSSTDSIGKINDDPMWFVVAASTETDEHWNDSVTQGSNYSAVYCDIYAPGHNVKTTVVGGGHHEEKGTSIATPHVTAAMALIKARATHYSYLQIKNLLMNTVDVIEGFQNKCVSGGRLSIINAVNYLYSENRGAYTAGDLTGDGRVTTDDATLARQVALGNTAPPAYILAAMDVNGDGSSNSKDYLMISRFANQTYYFPPY